MEIPLKHPVLMSAGDGKQEQISHWSGGLAVPQAVKCVPTKICGQRNTVNNSSAG